MSDSELISGLLPTSEHNIDVDHGLMDTKSPSFYNMDMDLLPDRNPGDNGHSFVGDFETPVHGNAHGHEQSHSHTSDSGFGNHFDQTRDTPLIDVPGHENNQFSHPDAAPKPIDDEDNLFASGGNEWDDSVNDHQHLAPNSLSEDVSAAKNAGVSNEVPSHVDESLPAQKQAETGSNLGLSTSLLSDIPAQSGVQSHQQNEHQQQTQQQTNWRSPLDLALDPQLQGDLNDDLSLNFFAQEADSSGSNGQDGHSDSGNDMDIDLDARNDPSEESVPKGQNSEAKSLGAATASENVPGDSGNSTVSTNPESSLNNESDNELQHNGSSKSLVHEAVKLEHSTKHDASQEPLELEEISQQDSQPVDINADDKTRVRQSHAIIIPSYASWFNMKKIHQIEKDSLPEFFETSHPSKSPVIYADYRNFMINAYRLNPNEYLTLTSCRRTLVGDVGTLMRVHRFLNKWGLINYQVNPQFKPAYALEKTPDGALVGLPYCGDFHVQYDTPRGLFPFNTYKPLQGNVNVEKLKELVNSDQVKSAKTTRSIEEAAAEQDEEPPTKKQKFDTGDWSSKELANLLLGVQKHKNDWYLISKTVGNNRTPQECILKFIKLPIEDKYNKLKDEDLGILKYASNFPVMTADNPVISNLIFMTNLVDAEVVKAASGNASKIIDETLLRKVSEIYDDKKKQVSKNLNDEENKEDVDENGKASKEDIDEKLAEEFSTKSSGSPEDLLRDASTTVLGLLGARSHLFANYEEREMQKLTNTILNQELAKLDLKVKKINELEKIYQKERKNLARQQSEVFVDRLALTKTTIGITKKLNEVVRLLLPSEEGEKPTTNESDLATATKILGEVQSLLFKPVKHSLKETTENNITEAINTEGEPGTTDTILGDLSKPLSVVEPQSFKVWAP